MKSRKGTRKSSRKSTRKSSKKLQTKKSKKLDKSLSVDLDVTDKSLLDFKKNKSISVISKISDLKSSKIGELYDVKPIHDNMHRLCILKLHGKSSKEKPIPKSVSKNICECLFEKNKQLSIAELEHRVSKRHDTPASECINILDKYHEQNARKSSSSRTTTSYSHNTRKTIKHKKKH